jgi:hypothetical protein
MAQLPPIFFVSGAFGSGKSTFAPLVSGLLAECFVFDADWLLIPLSALAGRNLWENSDPTLPDVWLAVAGMAAHANRSAVIFSPCEPHELEDLPSRRLVGESHWLLLDCADHEIRSRLEGRGWKEDLIRESLDDANRMRRLGLKTVRTDTEPPPACAIRVVNWVRERLSQHAGAAGEA